MIEIFLLTLPAILLGALGILKSSQLGTIIILSVAYLFACSLQNTLSDNDKKARVEK